MSKKRKQIEQALSLIRQSLIEKYGSDSAAQIIINVESVSLDDDDCIIVREGLEDAVAEELTKP